MNTDACCETLNTGSCTSTLVAACETSRPLSTNYRVNTLVRWNAAYL